jgi:hypothetical protein
LMLKRIVSPRQARDKYRESTQKEMMRFSYVGGNLIRAAQRAD